MQFAVALCSHNKAMITMTYNVYHAARLRRNRFGKMHCTVHFGPPPQKKFPAASVVVNDHFSGPNGVCLYVSVYPTSNFRTKSPSTKIFGRV